MTWTPKNRAFREVPEALSSIIPEGERPCAKVDHFRVDRMQMMFASLGGDPFADTDPSRLYTRLQVRDEPKDRWTLMMTDTDMERRTNWGVLHAATGRVLIAGLGIGMIVIPILKNPDVTSVTVVEKNPDVIALVEPYVRRKKLTVVQADIFEWRPAKDTKYDTIYFDIWADRCEDNLLQMATLHQRFKYFKVAGGWMDSWYRDFLRAERRRNNSWW